ncbi:MAG: ribonuclease Z, partial [Bacteroidota bacterium]|nr:ribonuclease Z [Bacteroidota bacterium]
MAFELTILGSSAAVPTSKRNLTAHVLNVHERFFLLDCGEGTQIQIRQNRIPFAKIDNIFISHIHGDHVFGLFGLISTFNLLGRTKILNIYAHSDLEIFLSRHIQFFEKNLAFEIKYHHINPKKYECVFESDDVEVFTIPLKHRIPCCGYKFVEKKKTLNIKSQKIKEYNISVKSIKDIKKGKDFISDEGDIIPNKKLTYPPYKQRSFAYCTDTAYSEKIVPLIKNVDLLFHEATFASDKKKQAKETLHSTG